MILDKLAIAPTPGARKTGSVYLSDVWNAWWPSPEEDPPSLLHPLGATAAGHHPARETLILVHGHYWMDNIGTVARPMDRAFLFEPFRSDVRFRDLEERYNVYSFLYPTHVDYSRTAGRLAEELHRLPRPQGSGRDLTIIAHSMGGLVARYALQQDGLGERVSTLFTLATPHHGTLLASIILARLSVWRKIGLPGFVVWLLARKLWRPTPGMQGMAYDNLDDRIDSGEIDRFGLAINERLATLNRTDPYKDRLVCLMGRVEGRWMPGRNVFDQIPRWYLGWFEPEFKYLDPLITPDSGLASGLDRVKARKLLEGYDHESILTHARPISLLYQALLGSARRFRRRLVAGIDRSLLPAPIGG